MELFVSFVIHHYLPFIDSCGVLKVNDQDGASQNPPSGKTQTDLLLSSRPYDDDRSLGLTGINWVFNFLIEAFVFLMFNILISDLINLLSECRMILWDLLILACRLRSLMVETVLVLVDLLNNSS